MKPPPVLEKHHHLGPLSATLSLLFAFTALGDDAWPRPVVIPLPDSVPAVSVPVRSLNGTWKFTMTPPADFWENAALPSTWADITVPGEPWMQGHLIASDVEYPYKHQVDVPAEFAGQRVFIRFDGIYSYARVWVNGQYLGDHSVGFNSWQVEITDHVTPGQSAWLTIAFTDPSNDLSHASLYASNYLGRGWTSRRIGGILRDVTLFALPPTHLTRLHVVTDLDASYEDASLSIESAVDFVAGTSTATVEYLLTDPSGAPVVITPSTAGLTSAAPESTVAIPVTNPLKWDAEHPHLYTLEARLSVGGTLVQTLSRRLGFREIEMDGNRMLVNGSEVKLRGGNRHSAHPLSGRADLPGLDEADVILYKEANVNYVRTSHYPCNTRFLELCDQYGIYVEEEMAICWAQNNGVGTENDPSLRPYFMTAISEILERDRSHPSIVMWSLGNENHYWGTNFEDERDYARAEDPTRPIKTGHNHYGVSWNTDAHTDLDSYHYPSWNSDFSKSGKPYIFDEYCHVRSYYGQGSIPDLDPNVRSYWGESLKIFWDAMFPASGTLGAATWGTIDDVFLAPSGQSGYGRWGIFDGWRRPKPEYWVTKKGYSPVRIANTPLGNPGSGSPLSIPVTNWFDHTDFNELEIAWQVGGESGIVASTLAPHSDGTLTLPGRAWDDDDLVHLVFTAHQPGGYSYVADEFLLPLTIRTSDFPAAQGPAPTLVETASEITVTGDRFELIFDKNGGLMRSGTYDGQLLIIGGPELNLTPYATGPFSLASISARTESPQVIVDIVGSYGGIGVTYELRMDGTGLIETTYTVTNPPASSSSYAEVGLRFRVADAVDRLEWDRNGFYSIYPPDHISRNQGGAARLRPGSEQSYREKPSWPWAFDMKDFHQYGPDHEGYGMTHDFRSSKEYIYSAAATVNASRTQVRAESDGATHAVRMGPATQLFPVIDDRDPSLVYSGAWSPYDDPNDYAGTEMFSDQQGAYVEYSFTGTSARFISARNNNLGMIDILLDDTLVADDLDCYAPSKQHQEILYEINGLADTNHTLRVVVTGTKNANASHHFALVDGFSAVPEQEGMVDDRDPSLVYDGAWEPYDLDPDNFAGTETFSSNQGAYVEYRFAGPGARWIGARAANLGKADVYLDGTRVVEALNLYASSKQHQQVLFETSGLGDGPHALRVVVRGDKDPASSDAFVVIDGFATEPPVPDLALHVNRHWAYELGWGNLNRTSQISSGFTDTITLRLMEAQSSGAAFKVNISSSPTEISEGIVRLHWGSDQLAFYDVEFALDLVDWMLWVGFLPAMGTESSYAVDLLGHFGHIPDAGFFRIREHR